ncbi:MAG: hypothetical protein ABW158_14875, partial [Candidatus Thiodiazotropha sp. 6PDIVS]
STLPAIGYCLAHWLALFHCRHKIEKYDFSFWTATNPKNSGTQQLSLIECQRSKIWINKVYIPFDKVITDL